MKIRTLVTGLHAGVVLCLAFVVAGLVYVMARYYHVRIDFTPERSNSLSLNTRNVLQKFGHTPIQVLAFYPTDDPIKIAAEDLLKEFVYVDSHFTYQMIDPDRSPSLAQKYEVDAYGMNLIRALGKEVRLEAASEEDIAGALEKILSNEVKTVYVVKGHGESGLQDKSETGYFSFLMGLKGSLYRVKEIDLTKEGIPKDAALLILAGPHIDLKKEEIERLDHYFRSGGQLILAVDPVLPGEGNRLQAFLLKQGILLGNDVIVDPLSKKMGADFLISMTIKHAPHPIFQNVRLSAFFPLARSVRKAEKVPHSLKVTELAWTSPESWAETDLKALESGKVDYDEGIDFAGPVALAAVSEMKEGKGRMVVLGDSDVLSNAQIHLGGNHRLVMNIVQWLSDDQLVLSRELKKYSENIFVVSAREETLIFFICVIGTPALFLAIGLIFSFWRKRYE